MTTHTAIRGDGEHPRLTFRCPRAVPHAASYAGSVEMRFRGELWYWRGPAPFHFVTVPSEESAAIHDIAPRVTMVRRSTSVGRKS